MYTYHGDDFDWLLGDDEGFNLHQECTKVFDAAKDAAKKAGQKVMQDHKNSLALTKLDGYLALAKLGELDE